mmetsp:Transcript_59774/g.122640  ORF Transcript_59774/g.122640 Transcript_59774/m.122640 type:complete len:208 (-) Transcript_59774:768-1391(-)
MHELRHGLLRARIHLRQQHPPLELLHLRLSLAQKLCHCRLAVAQAVQQQRRRGRQRNLPLAAREPAVLSRQGSADDFAGREARVDGEHGKAHHVTDLMIHVTVAADEDRDELNARGGLCVFGRVLARARAVDDLPRCASFLRLILCNFGGGSEQAKVALSLVRAQHLIGGVQLLVGNPKRAHVLHERVHTAYGGGGDRRECEGREDV